MLWAVPNKAKIPCEVDKLTAVLDHTHKLLLPHSILICSILAWPSVHESMCLSLRPALTLHRGNLYWKRLSWRPLLCICTCTCTYNCTWISSDTWTLFKYMYYSTLDAHVHVWQLLYTLDCHKTMHVFDILGVLSWWRPFPVGECHHYCIQHCKCQRHKYCWEAWTW